MAGTGKKWLIGCGAGCASLILVSIILSVVGGILMTRPMNRAVGVQKELDEAFGRRAEFRPPARLEPERIEAFLAVRAAVIPSCKKFAEIADSFRAMEEMEDHDGDPPVGMVLKNVGHVMGAAFGLAGEMGKLTVQRNEALLTQEMSLGEYTWIYVLAYNSYLGKVPNTGLDEVDGHGYCSDKLALLQTLMESHAEMLDEAGDGEQADLWRREAGRLRRVDEGVPFVESPLPGDLVRVFRPYRVRLEKSYCASMADFDLDRLEKKNRFSYHSD